MTEIEEEIPDDLLEHHDDLNAELMKLTDYSYYNIYFSIIRLVLHTKTIHLIFD
jgi:hypothetical protein